jgi:DNA-binding GntR family transcriptional regulator
MKKKLSEELREAIEEKIAFGTWPPGMRLDESALAILFGVSRTPLREALIQLSSLGVVEIRPHRGAVVAALEPQRLIEMFEVMAELEAMCARLAARRITAQELLELRAAHEECSEQAAHAEENAYYYANERFHAVIYRASHNHYLAEQADLMHRRLRVYRRLQLRARGRLASSFDEHGSVVEAIASGDAELAATRLRDHVRVQGDRFADLLASLQWQPAA